ncbi:hypothetical protein PHYSODRAFT_493573 [Phytophthora sojae]|uniref:Uncharacterized protein n=1 Tax=Phytophthora sojae (strain P6497) TaxID=1094619 RepID=G4ZAI3_PHYSP|nr:hypothetical protein PHYSODRAFT_493573 [Phytophthora sojae]EGZ19180.1 hypothetical protein PHYSODRAFT_493573 [Phytophthora sojae]|eukprot:XP_009521897.1 hypothetical protein PHYSODRAFT_493573 [Phytophthora sojae]
MSPRASKQSPASQYVDLSPWAFALWWMVLFVVHVITGGYNAAYAMFYWELQNTYLYLCLDYSGIGMPADAHSTIAIVNAVLAGLHGVCLLSMVGASLWRRELAFSPWPEPSSKRGLFNKAVVPTADDRFSSRITSARTQTVYLYSLVWGRQGVLGVNGNKFHVILVVREFIETALQTVQAYRMSRLLPRVLLNRFYVCLLVLNCWSSVLIYSLLRHRIEAQRRFTCLLCDCILDLVSCVGVPLIMLFSYLGDYDAGLTGFDMEKWYDDVWSAHALNEFQMIVVVSWSDLASRAFLSLGLIFTTTNLKELLRKYRRRIASTANSIRIPDKMPSLKSIALRARGRQVLLHLVHFLFAVWGVVVLSLHIQASVRPKAAQCVLQVFPWAESNPSCYLAVLDCYRLGISGKLAEVEDHWSEFDRSTVVTLVMRHCPNLEIPDMLADFHLTTGIKVYNSTIQSWEASAAITNTNHPELIWFYLVRVNLTDGVLPQGAQSLDFPAKLYDIEFCYTNLRELPDDLDSKWLIGTAIYMEYCQLTTVPLVLTRLDPYYLALTGNPITELPPELFEVPDMFHLGLGNTSIAQLPRNVTNLSPLLSFIHFTNTDVSFFWAWIDPLIQRALGGGEAPLKMGGSTYCFDVENVIHGNTDTFSVLPSGEYSPMLMDASEANRDVILQAVDCDLMHSRTFYPIAFEDSISSL